MQRTRIDYLLSAMLGICLSSTVLSACVAPQEVSSSTADRNLAKNQRLAERDERPASQSNSQVATTEACTSTDSSLQPLTTPEDGQLFEQFNFQPQDIVAMRGSVSVKTPYYVFSKCAGKRWAIASNTDPTDSPLSYAQYLNLWGNPDYTPIEFDGKTYEYRIRLKADWLDEQLAQSTESVELEATIEGATTESADAEDRIEMPAVTSTEDELGENAAQAEEAVYFDLKTPDGKVTRHQLYTMADVQSAGIGASLGVPRIADTVVTEGAIWFAATSSQGEGESGFASLLRYSPESNELTIQQPDDIQGDQITSMVATTPASQIATDSEPADSESTNSNESDEGLTLWLGTMRSGEGNPTSPASGLVAYRPATDILNAYTLNNSPIVGAIPHRLAIASKSLWVATGNGICEVDWQTIDQAKAWSCWQFTATAVLPKEGVALYDSFLSEEAATTLEGREVEVLWVSSEASDQFNPDRPGTFRYEVVYEPGFEKTLAQGGYRLNNEVARKMSGGEAIFWPGRQWHWQGDRFTRTLDEVSLNLVGGGPQGLIGSNISTGFSFDHYAIRGDFDLLSLGLDGTEVRYYSGWVEGAELEVYPKIVATQPVKDARPNPLGAIAQDLPNVGP